ncbi:MAG: hypothetical protein NTX69_06395, partial [Candidatus Bipolaricaulota bacterium]|nr:hypothetical protein [Candidatus Bipolaricaulota bacterium]
MMDLQGSTSGTSPSLDWLPSIASSLCRPPSLRPQGQQPFPSSCSRRTPSCVSLREIVDALRSALFPGYFCVPGVPEGDLCG